MSLHTEDDGKTPDDKILPCLWDAHYKALAPSLKLVGDHYKRNLPWDEYEARYLNEIRTQYPKTDFMQILIESSMKRPVTIMCKEPTPEFCHRRLLAEECKRLCPDLEVIIR